MRGPVAPARKSSPQREDGVGACSNAASSPSARPASGLLASGSVIEPVNAPGITKAVSSMDDGAAGSARSMVARYFDMWNTGDVSIAAQILHPDWIDHAHPEVTGVDAVQQAVQSIRAARPELHFHIDAILGDDDLVAVVGAAGRSQATTPSDRLIWLIRLAHGRMAEMWTFQQNQASR